jgi:hypothetical protein
LGIVFPNTSVLGRIKKIVVGSDGPPFIVRWKVKMLAVSPLVGRWTVDMASGR